MRTQNNCFHRAVIAIYNITLAMLKLLTFFSVFQFIWLFSIITLGPVTYGEKAYPEWAVKFGWCLGVCSVVPIPLIAAIQIFRQEGTIVQVIISLYSRTSMTRTRMAHLPSLIISLQKHAYSNILKISPPKTESFQIKILIFIFLLKIAGTCLNRLAMFLSRNKNNNLYPCKPQFYKNGV